ncbi:PP2C family serine/threonine-protein phosphatase [Streptomyces griseorubiginosus]|uniref:PP2C family serine/threonine-protein phosphatase n=1 Tax=Streptomyces griseorubiginosus TaxID=67304 RepID=UPI00215B2A9B|nr:protein phosphatase 2C domain-containing protein [Streptomyces griseorubiginosus]
MSQQGGRPTGHEDDWWGQLYDSTDDTGPAPAPDTLDDRFASAAGAVEDGGGGAAGPSARPAAGVPAPRFPEPGVTEPGFSEPGVTEPGFPSPGVVESRFPEPGATAPSFSEPGATASGFSEPEDVPLRASGGRDPRFPESPPGTAQGPVAFPPGPKPPGFDERGPSDLPSSPPGGRTSTETPPVTNVPASRRPPDAPSPPTAAPPPPTAPPRPATPPPLPEDGGSGQEPRTADPGVGQDPRMGDPDEGSVSPGGTGDGSAQAGSRRPGTAAARRDEPTHRAEGDWWAAPAPGAPQPAAPTAPTGPGSTQPNPTPEPPDQVRDANSGADASPQRGETTADRPPEPDPHSAPNASSAPGPTAAPAAGSHPAPPPDRPSAAPHVTSPPSPTPNPAVGAHPTSTPDRPPVAPHLTSPPSPTPDPLRTATRVDLPTLPPAPVGFVGSGPPTYDAEPTALPPADPDELDDLVADTVLDGARYGACTLRAVSVRGDSARFRGEPRRDSLLTARFGTGDQALVLVAMATGARATPGAHRAAAEACQWIARAVGRSHARLAQDIGAARRGDLKSGLHRLTDRSLGRLRASAAEQGIDPEEYAATLRCLLLPADPECRVRVFFGVGDGGLFRLRDGEWHDIEPLVGDVTGEPVVGFGSLPSETPDGDRLTMDLGIPTPPSPYEPAPEPPRAPFRFRASVARPGDTLLMCTGGLAEPLRGEPELCEYLTGRWSGPPPGLATFLADSQVRVKGYADDRTAAAVWEA